VKDNSHRNRLPTWALLLASETNSVAFQSVLRGTEVGFLQPTMSSISSSMLFSSSPRPPPPPQVLRVSSLYTAKPSFSDSMATSAPKWAQKTITLPPHRRGCHLITPKVSSFFDEDTS